MTQENSGYYTFTYWFYGNGFIRKVWEGNDPALLAEREQVLKDTPKSQSLAFSFDQTDYSMEMTQINNVIEQYRPELKADRLILRQKFQDFWKLYPPPEATNILPLTRNS